MPSDSSYSPEKIVYAECSQNDVPDTLVVKAFNTLAQEICSLPAEKLRAQNIMCPYCMDSEKPKQTIIDLINSKVAGSPDIRKGMHLISRIVNCPATHLVEWPTRTMAIKSSQTLLIVTAPLLK